jgi:DNA polymerase-3 subunit beta
MKIEINQPVLLSLLTKVYSSVSNKSVLPILANILIKVKNNQLTATGTDLETEQVATIDLDVPCADLAVTVPARKLMDIVKSLPKDKPITITIGDAEAIVKSGRSRYKLSTLPSADYPDTDDSVKVTHSIVIESKSLNQLFHESAYSMANQDVRYYLNGLNLNVSSTGVTAVSTDGHRIAYSHKDMQIDCPNPISVIVPRNAISIIQKLLSSSLSDVLLEFSTNHLRIVSGSDTFTTKLIDGKFPDYNRVIPRDNDTDSFISVDVSQFKSSLSRVSILANEKFKGATLSFTNNTLMMKANNPDQEQSEETVDIDYTGRNFELGVNVGYVLDVLNNCSTSNINIIVNDGGSAFKFIPENTPNNMAVVMSMRV